MSVKLKKLGEQVMVIAGASSGIGLATAHKAARRGTKLVLAARNGVRAAQTRRRDKRRGRPGHPRCD